MEYNNFFNCIESIHNSKLDSNLIFTPFIISQLVSKPTSVLVFFDLLLQLFPLLYTREYRWLLLKELIYTICLLRIALHQISQVKDMHLESAMASYCSNKKCSAAGVDIIILLLPFLREMVIFASINHYLLPLEIEKLGEINNDGLIEFSYLLSLFDLNDTQFGIKKTDPTSNFDTNLIKQFFLNSFEASLKNESAMIVESNPPNVLVDTFATVIETLFGVSENKYQLPFSLTPNCFNLYSSKFQGRIDSLDSIFYLDYYKLPTLINLPETYHTLFQFMSDPSNICKHCRINPKEPAICLVCGELLCAVSSCCVENSKGELTRHAKSCSGDHGVFLLLRHSGLIFIYDGMSIIMPSPYLDSREEEDLGLKRGKALFLNKARWADLQRLYSEQIIPQEVCRRRTHANGYERYAHNIW